MVALRLNVLRFLRNALLLAFFRLVHRTLIFYFWCDLFHFHHNGAFVVLLRLYLRYDGVQGVLIRGHRSLHHTLLMITRLRVKGRRVRPLHLFYRADRLLRRP